MKAYGIEWKKIKHKRYKYQLTKGVCYQPFKIMGFYDDIKEWLRDPTNEDLPFCFYDYAVLIRKDYCWDGASGPTIDTKNTMKASLVHDVFYQCFREGWLDRKYRKYADELFYDILREDGMSRVRAKVYYYAVRMFGRWSAKGKIEKYNP